MFKSWKAPVRLQVVHTQSHILWCYLVNGTHILSGVHMPVLLPSTVFYVFASWVHEKFHLCESANHCSSWLGRILCQPMLKATEKDVNVLPFGL